MERFRPDETSPKPILLDRSAVLKAKALCDQAVKEEETRELEGLIKSLPDEHFKDDDAIKKNGINDSPAKRIRRAFRQIKDTIYILGDAQATLIVPVKDDKGEEVLEFALPETGQEGKFQIEETLTAEEKSDRIRKALNQTIRTNFLLISTSAQEIVTTPYTIGWESTEIAEKIVKTIGGPGRNNMIHRLSAFTRA